MAELLHQRFKMHQDELLVLDDENPRAGLAGNHGASLLQQHVDLRPRYAEHVCGLVDRKALNRCQQMGLHRAWRRQACDGRSARQLRDGLEILQEPPIESDLWFVAKLEHVGYRQEVFHQLHDTEVGQMLFTG